MIFTSLQKQSYLDFRKQIFLYWSSFCCLQHIAWGLSHNRHPINVQTEVLECVLGRVRFFATSWTVVCQAPLPMGLSRQEYWSGLPFSTLGDLPNSGIKSGLLCFLHWKVDSLENHWATWEGKGSGSKLITENRQWWAKQHSRTYVWVRLNFLFHENVDIKHSFMATAYSGKTKGESTFNFKCWWDLIPIHLKRLPSLILFFLNCLK